MTFLIALLATSIWFPPQFYIDKSDLIAIVNIGPIHEAKTPDGTRLFEPVGELVFGGCFGF